MTSPFDELDINKAKKLLKGISAHADLVRKYFEGDHWQNGDGWVGPGLKKGTENYSDVQKAISKSFVSKNAVKEVIERHISGVMGREPMWRLTTRRAMTLDQKLTDAEKNLISEAEAAITQWWQKNDIHLELAESMSALLYSERRVYRLVIPRGRLNEEGVIPNATLEDAWKHVFLDIPSLDKSVVVRDTDYMAYVGVYAYKEGDKEVIELTYLDDEGNTVLRQLSSDSEAEPAEPMAIDMGEHLWMYELRRRTLITPQVLQNQRLLNMALTMLGRNTVQGGFLERIILNAQPPQKVTTDPATGVTRADPLPFVTGAGTTNFLNGIMLIDPTTGKPVLGNPSVVYRDPVSIETFVGARAEAYKMILEETHQLHSLISGDAFVSGESRIQARSDFLADLQYTAPRMNAMLTWLIEAVLSIIAVIGGEPGRYSELRAMVEVRPDTGPLTSDERRVVIERYKDKILSRESAVSLLGTDDVDGEILKIESERYSNVDELLKIAGLAEKLNSLAGSNPEILLMAQFSEGMAKKLAEEVPPLPEVEPNPNPTINTPSRRRPTETELRDPARQNSTSSARRR